MENENKPKKSRFASYSDADLNKLIEDKDAKNTKKATELAVRVFRSYLCEKGLSERFEDFSAEQLDSVLCKFFAEIRQKNREVYKKTSLIGIRHGISRFLDKFDIVKGSDFKNSQQVFQAMVAELKRQGAGGIDHYPPMEKQDLLKLYAYFDVNDPENLQEKVFVDVMLHFGRRGRENLRNLCVNDFGMTTDGDGLRYIYLRKDEQTKNHQLDTNTAKGSMYEIKGYDEKCPVRTFLQYKRLLPLGCSYLFPRPLKTPTKDGYYFSLQPIGHNKLGGMMATLSRKAGLSRMYTNHSLRATAVHILDGAQIPTRHIMTVTGHKAESSLKTYTGYTDDSTKKAMSHTLSKSVGLTMSEKSICDKSENVPFENNFTVSDQNQSEMDSLDLTTATLDPLTNSQFDEVLQEFNDVVDPFDDILRDISLPNTYVNQQQHSVMNFSSNMHFRSLPFPVITGANASVTINYNIINK